MTLDDVIKFIQRHFTDGLVLVVASGLSTAEGMPGMPALADHLKAFAFELQGGDATVWSKIANLLEAKKGLEAALNKYAPSESLETWIRKKTCELLLPVERELIGAVVRGERTLRLTTFLSRILKPANGLPILTPNYDRLIEVACEMAGFHVDTAAIGNYAGAFDQRRSCMASCRGIVSRGRTPVLEHFPRAIVLKPHGSIDWYRNGDNALRCSLELDAERLIITPGLNKYKVGYDFPFDMHREVANNYIDQAARLLVVGYGFNDDHLQTHLMKRIRDGTPTLILTRTANKNVQDLSQSSPNCVCLARSTVWPGVAVMTSGTRFEQQGRDLWDLDVLAKELLS
ncbi:MAG: SIR2 family protein [Terriglobia bacterium]